MLHHGGQGDGGHHQDSGEVKLGHLEGGQAQDAGLAHGGEIDEGDGLSCGVQHSDAAGVHDEGGDIGDHHAHQNGDDLEHPLPPDVEDDDGGQGDQGQRPAGGGVAHRGGGQGQANAHNDGAGDHRGQEAHDLLHAHQADDQGQRQVEQAGNHDAAAGIGQLILGRHVRIDAGVQIGHGAEAAQEGKGGAQKGRHPEFGAHMEEQGADAGKEQSGLDVQGQTVLLDQDGDQDGSAEHGEHVLEAQHQHLGGAQLPGVADGFVWIHG